jgi:fermentation-respiration switch protein FrsA (DUF1100 family)
MKIFWILLAVVGGILLLSLITALICFLKVFYSPKRKQTDEYPIPDGDIYEPYRESMVNWIRQRREMPHRAVEVISYDGLTLRGNYYEYAKGAPMEIMFHGYRGSSERDLSGGVARCFALGHSALVVDHRGSGFSDGRVITFGIKERRDCLTWIDFALREIDPEARLILTGISMGAATVLMCGAEALPENVIGILADCGYTSAREIICKVVAEMKLPPRLLYPFIRLGARLFGGFDPDETSPIRAMESCRVPVIFFHGDTDDFVPYEMSKRNYDACHAKKRIVKIHGAGHGLCFPVDQEAYLAAAREFFHGEE